MFFSSNLKIMRKRLGRTQDDVAVALNIKRSTLSGYENEVAQPPIDILISISKYFNVSVDTLVKIDLSKLAESQLSQLERGLDVYISGSSIRVLATTVDKLNNENIELVPEKAKAGYSSGFADPEFIKVLPTFQLPFLSREKKYRTFQISGDSMLPIPDGSWITAEFVQNWNFIRDRHAYIVLTIEDGIVFKVVENQIKNNGKLILHSLNSLYKPYEIAIKDIKEVWKFVNYISSELPEPNQLKDDILKTVVNLRHDVDFLKSKMGNK